MTQIRDYTSFFASLTADDTVVLCGGDGTLNRFVNDTEGMEIPCDLLYYAAGTGNDFLRDIEKQPSEKPFSIKEYLQALPFVEVNGSVCRFLNGIGFGIDGYCCEVGDQLKQTSDKPVNYTAIAIKGLLFHYKPTNATVTVDGTSYQYQRVWIAATMKGRFYGGGMMAAPKQDRTDETGEISLVVWHDSGKIKTLAAFPSIFKGDHVNHTDMISIHTGHEISVTFDRPTALQIDGETVLGVTDYRVSAHSLVPTGVTHEKSSSTKKGPPKNGGPWCC